MKFAGLFLVLCLGLVREAQSAPARVINFQGRALSNGAVFSGAAQFRFALVNAAGSEVYWRNSADANLDGIPDEAVSVTVDRGLYAVLLGDGAIAHMAPIAAEIFTNEFVYLRVWFSEGARPVERLAPDQRVSAAGYALMAATVPDGAITEAKFAPTALSGVGARIDAVAGNVAGLSNQVKGINLAGITVVSAEAADANLLSNGFRRFNSLAAPAWRNGSAAAAPDPRYLHASVWTGQRWVIWGGLIGAQESGQGGIYDPNGDQWEPVAIPGAPAHRWGHSAVWTGDKMIVWGGESGGEFLNTGGRWQAEGNEWLSTKTAGAPEGRAGHVAVWTGNRMLIWGGHNSSGLLNDGSLYDPVLNEWTALNLPNAPEARIGATAVWAGDRLLIWGGEGAAGVLNSGAQLRFAAGAPTQWQSMSTANAPSARGAHTAVWTGSSMIVWGGQNGAFIGDGGAYDAANNVWTPIVASAAASARAAHCAIWTGDEMLVFGGENSAGSLNNGAAFNPTTGSWRALSGGGSPLARAQATAAWTGTELLIFGGRANGTPAASLQRLDPQPAWHFYRKL